MMEDVNLHSSGQQDAGHHTVIGGFRVQRRNILIAAAVVILLLVVLIPVLILVPGSSSSSSSSNVSSGSGNDDLYKTLENNYGRNEFEYLDFDALQDKRSPQYKAYIWLSGNANLEEWDHTKKLQRYALACFFYSTNEIKTPYSEDAPEWEDSSLWLSDEDECTWFGISCNDAGHVNGIDLESNSLTGSFPPEMVWLPHMETLDLTSNFLFLSTQAEMAVLGVFKNLKSLLLDDNFILSAAGLPESIGNLSNLEKLRLSYNLIEGPFQNGVIDRLTKLTHLEVESNFLTGIMPPVIGTMTDLVYLYARRNNLEFNLDFIKSGEMKNIFSLWLDSNLVTGTVPTEIGLLQELASLSFTDAQLHGTIPTEIGNLQKLRRFWIYKNKLEGTIPTQMATLPILEVFQAHDNLLTGSMPQGVCSTLQAATYASKSLTADCEEVACTNCCTQCFP